MKKSILFVLLTTALFLFSEGSVYAQRLAHSAAINGVRERIGRAAGPDKDMILNQCIDLLKKDIETNIKEKDREESYYYLASVYYRMDNYEEAYKAYQLSLSFGKKWYEKQEKLTGGAILLSIKDALADMKLKYFNQATRAYNEGVNKSTLDSMKVFFDKTVDRFTKIIEWDPKVEINGQSYISGVYGTLVNIYILTMNKETDEQLRKEAMNNAIKYMEQLLTVDPKNMPVYQFITQLYEQDKNYDKALEWTDKALKVDAADSASKSIKMQMIARKAMILQVTNRPDDALKTYEEAIRSNPDNADLHFNLASLYIQRKETDKALVEFKIVKKLNPNDVESNFQVADEMFRYYIEKRKETIEKNGGDKADMKKVTELVKPVIEDTKLAVNDAIAVLEPTLATATDKYEVNYRIGKLYNILAEMEGHLFYNLENKEKIKKQKPFFEKAVPYLKTATELKPDSKNAWMQLGTAYLNLQMKKEAEDAFAKTK